MPLDKLNRVLEQQNNQLEEEGRAKKTERIITNYIKPKNQSGERYQLQGFGKKEFIRMNSNSYLALSNHPEIIAAADQASHRFGVGPGAVRFIDGTYQYHIDLEIRIAAFVQKEAAKIFNSAYTANLALALTLHTQETFWVGDELNHNSIIRSMRIAGVPSSNRSIFQHNNMQDLEKCLSKIPPSIKRVCIIFDGVFSMRGDFAPMQRINKIAQSYHDQFEEGVITIVDDSHGIGAYGKTARGTSEFTHTDADIIVGTFGKAFGVNGGFIASSEKLTETIRQKADTYIYTNPLGVADCAAIIKSIDLVDSPKGIERLLSLHKRTEQFRKAIRQLELETIDGYHPVVPILVRDTLKTHQLVSDLFDAGIMVVGLTFPVVPKGSETIRTQLNAGITESDIEYVILTLKKLKEKIGL